MTDLYAILGVAPGSDEVVIHAASRALMRKFHPDTNPSPEALRRSADINAAFAILGGPTRRAACDASRSPQGHDAEPGSDSKLIARVLEANSSDRVESNDEHLHGKRRPQRRKNDRTRYGWRAVDEDIVESERQLAAEERREERERLRRVSNWALGIFGACLVGASGSLTAAAAELGISAQMAGRYLRHLEDRLGVTLLVRATRHQRLSEAGRAFLERARVALSAASEAEDVGRGYAARPKGELRLSAPVAYGSAFLTPRLGGFLRSFPEVAVELVLMDRLLDPSPSTSTWRSGSAICRTPTSSRGSCPPTRWCSAPRPRI